MYCYKCGAKNPDDAGYCYKCGSKIKFDTQIAEHTEKISNNTEIDRKALTIYLRDLLGLEYVLKRYKEKLLRWKDLLSRYNYSCLEHCFFKTYYLTGDDDWINYYGGTTHGSSLPDRRTCLHYAYSDQNGGMYYIKMLSSKEYGAGMKVGEWFPLAWKPVTYLEIDRLNHDTDTHQWLALDKKGIDYLTQTTTWDASRIKADYIKRCEGFLKRKEKNQALLRAVNAFQKTFEQFKKDAQQGLASNRKTIQRLKSEITGLQEETNKFNKLLQKAYNYNIIPNQFRNIYTVYYLYDFVQSSNESLTTALLHFDLNQIKNRLDKIIKQQEEIIINQMYLQSQNSQILQQNQDYLRKLDSIDSTGKQIANATRETSIYASMAATNAEAAALIGIANYLK